MPRKADDSLTEDQADDLATHLLGPGWYAMHYGTFADGHKCRLGVKAYGRTFGLDPATCHEADTWRDVFYLAGVVLPERGQFAAVRSNVVRGTEPIATCRSSTMAQRIANALNSYVPGPRGK